MHNSAHYVEQAGDEHLFFLTPARQAEKPAGIKAGISIPFWEIA